MTPPTFADVLEAETRLQGLIRTTPVHMSGMLDQLAGCELYFKCENFQKTGSFKYRGATNAVQKLDKATAARGVVTHSSGNHAQALALAAKVRGISAHVVMPRTASPIKKQAVIGYGGNVVECEPTLADRERVANEIVARTGGTLIPPFDHPDVIAGQATAACEFLIQVPLDVIIVPVGGGGMISGYCLAAAGAAPQVKIIGAEPELAGDAAESLASGVRQPQMKPTSIADGLLTSLGDLTWPIIQKHVSAIYTVSEDEIVAAMRLVWERMKLVIEPSAAVGVAVALRERNLGQRVGVVLCGGNVSLDKLPWGN
jgi:threonine dehydratase